MPNSNRKVLYNLTIKNIVYIIVIAILAIALCVYDLRWIIPAIFIFTFSIVYTIWVSGKKKTEIETHIQNIESDITSASKGNLINTPIPLVLIETNGNIVWRSKAFVKEFQNVDIATYLTSIVKEIKVEIEKNGEKLDITKQLNIENKIYKICGSIVKSKKKDKKKQREYVISLYFIDETKYNELFDEYNNSKNCIGVVTIDNYDEIVQRILPEKKIELLAKIEKQIIEWITKTGGLMVKTESDYFICVFSQQYLSEFEKERFNILDKVKIIEVDNQIQITLSIAISADGNTNYEKYKSALSAMEIVLGRGGDQAVVRKDGKYKFYGGKTLEIEKRTKVKARTTSHSVSKAINDADNIFIMGHRNIDIDSFGSALGMYRLCKTYEKETYIVSEPKGKSLGKFLEVLGKEDEYKDIIITEDVAKGIVTDNSLLIIVDTHKQSYVEFPELLNKIDKKIVIDHHRKAPDCIENALVSFHEVYASSAAELVTEIIQYSEKEVKLNLIEAESLYGGIMVDTKDFTFKTGVRTFEAAAYLRKYGVDIIRVKKWFQADLESYNTISDIVRNAEIINDSIAIAVFDKENEDANLICAKAADELLTISNITASFVMAKIEDKVFISGRSIGDINVQIILEKLGGGGHITLAGAQLEGLSLEEAKVELTSRINEYLLESE